MSICFKLKHPGANPLLWSMNCLAAVNQHYNRHEFGLLVCCLIPYITFLMWFRHQDFDPISCWPSSTFNQWEWRVLQCSTPCWFGHKKWTTYLLYLKYNYGISMSGQSASHLFYYRNKRHRKCLENEEHTCVWEYNKASLYIIICYKSFQSWQAVFQLRVTTAWCI